MVIPTVNELATGESFVAKQMSAKAGETMPNHHASKESILFIHEGEIILNINDEFIHLKPGEAVSIPALTKHQIKAVTDYKGIHFMPKEIEFKFFK